LNEASRWRLALGRQIGMAYAANPKARVVMVAGSTARGTADRYSDLEIDVYWSEPPTDDERRAAAEGSGGTLVDFWPYEEDEWAEEISFGGFLVGTSTFLVETMERYLTQVVDQHSREPLPQIRLFSLLHAQTIAGEDLVAQWRNKASAYPTELAQAMLRANLPFEGLGYAEDMLVARDDLLALYALICRAERQVLGALLGLNRLYLPNPHFKGTDELIAEMRLKPHDLSSRLKAVFRLPPRQGMLELHAICEEMITLVDEHMPAFDTTEYRENLRRRHGIWDSPPRL
jgi:hypothetical protein